MSESNLMPINTVIVKKFHEKLKMHACSIRGSLDMAEGREIHPLGTTTVKIS